MFNNITGKEFFTSFLAVPLDFQLSVGKLTDFSKAVSASLDELETKVAEAKKILLDINKLKRRRDFLSREQIEAKKAAVEERLMQSKRLQDEIKSLESDPGFLSEEDFRLCQEILRNIDD